MASSGDLIARAYGNFKGVDFGKDPGVVDLSRSPDALNVWKNYQSDSSCIQTRPGYRLLGQIGERINGMFVYSSTKAIVHSGTKLYLWSNFPETPQITILSSSMNNAQSTMILINGRLYIIDGLNYLVYDSTNGLKNVASEAYVPTTSMSRSPSGGGKIRDDVNLLTGKRINTFCGDGTSVTYYLDAQYITTVDKVVVNGTVMRPMTETETNPDYYIDSNLGAVIFLVAPSVPSILGQDNVEITFTKTITGYAERIAKCTIAVPCDGRIFFSGNPDYPNVMFHSSLDNPAYCSDLDYYEDGTSSPIKNLVVGNNVIYVIKDSNQDNDTLFYHVPVSDSEYGRVYPRKQGNISVGCYAGACKFRDTVVYLSRNGLEEIGGNIEYKQSLKHKSSNVDNKLITSNNYKNAKLIEWNDYLVVAIDEEMFLADSRQTFTGNIGTEYEWYYWKINENITCLKVYNNNLYFGTDDGSIFYFRGSNDNGNAIQSYWTTPMDQIKYPQYRKTTNKRGTIAKIKNLQNGKIKIYVKTDRKEWKLLKELNSKGFDFNNIDFSNFSFHSGDNFYAVFRVKMKKIKHITFKFECDELDKAFGIYQLNTSAYLGSFVK